MQNASHLQKIQLPGSDTAVHCETTTTRPSPYVLAALRRQVFDSIHGLGHLGTRATAKLISQLFMWRVCRKAAAPGHGHSPLASSRRHPGTTPCLWETRLRLHPSSSTCTFKLLAHFRHQMAVDFF
jgi:hypothetical protein